MTAARREIRYLRGTRSELLLTTAFPCLMLAILAWLLSSAVIRDLPIAVVDQDHSALSRDLVRRLDSSPVLSVATVLGDVRAAFSQVRSLDVYAVVLIPQRATRRLYREGDARLIVYYNASYLTPGQGASRDVATAVAAASANALQRDIAKMRGVGGLRAPPVAVQATTLSNPARSFEHYLLGLLFPAVLHLMASLGMVSALGREVRDATLVAWLQSTPHPVASLVGKLAPYVVWYSGLTCAALAYLALVRGGEIAGSAGMLGAGVLGLYLACAGLSLLLVGALRDMGTALSLCGLYVGTALAFSGATFPVIGATAFARFWNALLPLTAYLKLQAQQVDIGSPAVDSMGWLGALVGFCLVPGVIGGWLLLRQGMAKEAT